MAMKQWVKLIAGLATALAVSAAVWEPLATTPSPDRKSVV